MTPGICLKCGDERSWPQGKGKKLSDYHCRQIVGAMTCGGAIALGGPRPGKAGLEVRNRVAVERWNAAIPVGRKIVFFSIRDEPETAKLYTTRTAASVLEGHTPVVWVQERGDCVALQNCYALDIPSLRMKFGGQLDDFFRGEGLL